MNVQIDSCTAGRFGSMGQPLSYLDNLINEYLDNQDFGRTFEQLEIKLAYPPTYILKAVRGLEVEFEEHYKRLPKTKIYRRYKKIEIHGRCPELSEYSDDRNLISHQFDVIEIKDAYKGLSLGEVASSIMHCISSGLSDIQQKLKVTDDFDVGMLMKQFVEIQEKVSDDEWLHKQLDRLQQVSEREQLKCVNDYVAKKSQAQHKLDQRLYGIRIYDTFSTKELLPYRYLYSEVWSNLLWRVNILTPAYKEIYVNVSDDIDKAKRRWFAPYDWHESTFAVLDIAAYRKADAAGKKELLLQCTYQGLRDVFQIDGLDLEKLEAVFRKIKTNGLYQELVHRRSENDD